MSLFSSQFNSARATDILQFHQNWAILLICASLATPVLADSPIQLHDVTRKTGISFRHDDGSQGRYHIVEYVSAGLALFDFDNDGDIDIYFLNGAPPPGSDRTPQGNRLYRNDGNWRFTDISRRAKVDDVRHGLGVTVGDYDNDGDQDLYLNNFGPNVLYRNEGDGTFKDVTKSAGVGNGNRVGAGASFVDIDADGDLDLYVANYIKYSYDQHVPRTMHGYPVYGSPRDYAADPDTLYRNNGDGTFTDVSVASGVAALSGYGMGIIGTDYDSDGDTDILVGNDVGANFLLQNDGRGRFRDMGLLSGFAYDRTGTIQGTMGVDCADYDGDGHLDIHVTSYQGELATLYRNVDGVFVEDVTNVSGAGLGTHSQVTWGNGFVDLDNDGDRDIFIACGHLYDNVERFSDRASYHARNMFFLNVGNGRFVDATDKVGPGMDTRLSSRGAGFDDLDNDGDMDIVILNSRREPTLLRNEMSLGHHWIKLRLRGTSTNRGGVGARVEVVSGGNVQVDEVHSGRGYQGHHGSHLHFGLGMHAKIDEVRVRWLGGTTQVIKNVPVNRRVTITEGRQGFESR